MVNAKRSAASARASKTSATSRASESTKRAAASKAAKTAQASKTSKAVKTGTSAKRAARSALTDKTTKTGGKRAARGRVVTKKAQARAGGRLERVDRLERVPAERPERVVEPPVRPFRVTMPRVRVERLDAAERARLRELGALVAGGQDIEEIVVVGTGERRVSLTRKMLEGLAALGKVFDALARGSSVTVVADDEQAELTSQEAADLLNVSRPYVVKLARQGALAYHRVGNRHRFTLADVLDYRDQMRVVREEALAELAPTDGYGAADF